MRACARGFPVGSSGYRTPVDSRDDELDSPQQTNAASGIARIGNVEATNPMSYLSTTRSAVLG
jgi:hypothetical protein